MPNKPKPTNRYYRPYLREVLTSEGIVVTDGINNKYIKTVPDEDRVVMLLRKAISIWDTGDRNEFVNFVYNNNICSEFTIEEMSRFRSTIFTDNGPDKCDRFVSDDGGTNISWIIEAISIEESRSQLNEFE